MNTPFVDFEGVIGAGSSLLAVNSVSGIDSQIASTAKALGQLSMSLLAKKRFVLTILGLVGVSAQSCCRCSKRKAWGCMGSEGCVYLSFLIKRMDSTRYCWQKRKVNSRVSCGC